ncbi:hypothetical protein Ciccas_009067, partial [Cichlidogyrus casuarinus]
MQVNGQDLRQVQHQVAVSALRTKTPTFNMLVAREIAFQQSAPNLESSAPNTECDTHLSLTLKPADNGDYGFSIYPAQVGNLTGYFVDYVQPDSMAGAYLSAGDELVAMNGELLNKLSLEQVNKLIYDSTHKLELLIRRMPQMNGERQEQEQDVTQFKRPPRYEKGLLVHCVTVNRSEGSLGLSICGGAEHDCNPFSHDERGIFISRLTANGMAIQAGLRVGDRILSVNGIDLRQAYHEQAVEAILGIKSNELVFEVRQDPPPPGLREVIIHRMPGIPLGLKLMGGTNVNSDAQASPLGLTDFGIYVNYIDPEGLIDRDGRIKPGDCILEANDEWLVGAPLFRAVQKLQEDVDKWKLTVCDGTEESIRASHMHDAGPFILSADPPVPF